EGTPAGRKPGGSDRGGRELEDGDNGELRVGENTRGACGDTKPSVHPSAFEVLVPPLLTPFHPAVRYGRFDPEDQRSRHCPYLDTINKSVLDFDFEKLCSISLSHINVYACLVCGKYFQGETPSPGAGPT
uniref:UBP-type domain-containing protein n=1 Tax=Malurus cyaneus samueli TaxID=2593467 RepID=A0A8C5U5L8_9PASS